MVFTNVGIQKVVDYLRGASPDFPTHIAIGTDATTPNEDDTALLAEVKRVTIEETSNDTISVTFSFILLSTDANSYDLTEVGLFDANSGGNMFSRWTHGTIVKSSAYEVEYTMTIQVSN